MASGVMAGRTSHEGKSRQGIRRKAVTQSVAPVGRSSLTMRVFAELEAALLEGRLHPGQRLKVRELAAALEVSETPVREAIMQLVSAGALKMEAARSITSPA
jgi:DNA-binding GntR family transcriptional regulator